MNTIKQVLTISTLLALLNSSAVFGQTVQCFPLPPGVTTLPPGSTLPPGYVLCPTDPNIAPAPVPAPVAPPVPPTPIIDNTPAPAPAATPQITTINSGYVNEDHEGRGKKNGMDNGKKYGIYKDHKDTKDHLIMAGTISGDTLTVTAITSGHLEIGTILSGNGIPQPVKITAFGTGRGGVGTYTITTNLSK